MQHKKLENSENLGPLRCYFLHTREICDHFCEELPFNNVPCKTCKKLRQKWVVVLCLPTHYVGLQNETGLVCCRC